ncbi:MAG TPA: phenylalanine--tRNA ligase beta subunit-related protein [Solirubrobacteraceae bacterium]|nr:phenylalanine--tRNA ligase beta subunit-related protein [Solirubrobacteraceae bacterium]
MKIVHERLVAERFPGHVTAAVLVRGEGELGPREGAVEELRGRVAAADGTQAARRAAGRWREVFAAMGAKPKYGSSVQVLLEGYEERGSVPAPVALVELYCWYSLARGVPMAGYRPEGISGALRLAVPGKGVPFTPLGQPRAEPERTRKGEVAYVDDEKAICRYWNCRDCDQTKLTAGVAEALFVFDLLDEDPEDVAGGLASLLDGSPQAASGYVDGRERESVTLG